MNGPALAVAIRNHASILRDADQKPPTIGELADCSDLVLALARIVERSTEPRVIGRAFGAPGDWGYNSPIGRALADIPEKGGR
jgi:hypothetical protein